MTDCTICYRHHPDQNGDCTDRCRHTEASIGNVCARCHLRVLDDLDLIAEGVALTAPVSTNGSKVRQAFGSKPPVSADWLDWMRGDELRGCLGSWSRAIHEDHPDYPWPQNTSAAYCEWLRQRWHDVLPSHEAVAEFAAEVNVWAREARRILGRTKQGQVIACPGCQARLRVDIVADPDKHIECRRCGNSGTAAWLVRVASADGWADSEALTYLGANERTLRRWAVKGIVRTRGLRPVLYSVADVRREVG